MGESASDEVRSLSHSQASPAVAAAFAGVTAVMWSQALLRFLSANLSVEILNLIIPEKMTDVFATWLLSILLGVAVSLLAYPLLRRRRHFGSIRAWLILMLVSVAIRYL